MIRSIRYCADPLFLLVRVSVVHLCILHYEFLISLRYYLMVGARRMALGAVAIACVLMSDRLDVNMLGAVIMALFWQQCGWLAHDFLHHQVDDELWQFPFRDTARVVPGNFTSVMI